MGEGAIPGTLEVLHQIQDDSGSLYILEGDGANGGEWGDDITMGGQDTREDKCEPHCVKRMFCDGVYFSSYVSELENLD